MTYTPTQLREDMQFLQRTFEDVHIQPDWRVPQARRRELQRVAIAALGNCRSADDFWLVASRYLHAVADAHTLLEPPAGSDRRTAPIVTRWIDGHIVVDAVMSGTNGKPMVPEIRRGDVILFVGGEEAGSRIAEVVGRIPFNNTTWGISVAVERLLEYVGSPHRATVELVLAHADGQIYAVELPLLPSSHPVLAQWEQQSGRQRFTNCIETRMLDAGSGYLALRACVDRSEEGTQRFRDVREKYQLDPEDVPDVEETCWEFFRKLRDMNTPKLIVDLRGNRGGNSTIGRLLLKYLTRRGKLDSYRGDMRISPPIQTQYPQYASQELGHRQAPAESHIAYPYASHLDAERLAALQPFDGTVIVLIDHGVFSSGEWIAAELRGNGIGTFVGESTGGGGTAPGHVSMFTLPNTGLQLCVPWVLFRPPVVDDTPATAVVPHHYIGQTLSDYRKGVDTALESVRSLATGKPTDPPHALSRQR